LPWKGCGRIREPQSIRFFRTPGIEALYSGEAMIIASASSRSSLRRRAPGGTPSAVSASPS
jgi:hypothetical protein